MEAKEIWAWVLIASVILFLAYLIFFLIYWRIFYTHMNISLDSGFVILGIVITLVSIVSYLVLHYKYGLRQTKFSEIKNKKKS